MGPLMNDNRALLGRRGLSLVELIVTLTILTILAALVLPSAQLTAKRTKEIELRRNLRTIRTAIDRFKDDYDKAVAEKKMIPSANKTGYPESLKILVDGYDFGGLVNYKKKFLRRIPVDPFNPPNPGEEPKWGLRSYVDQPDSTNWGGEDVFDVYSLSDETAIDGSKYKDW
jgi:general secretion pathway protein G